MQKLSNLTPASTGGKTVDALSLIESWQEVSLSNLRTEYTDRASGIKKRAIQAKADVGVMNAISYLTNSPGDQGASMEAMAIVSKHIVVLNMDHIK